MKLKMEDNMVQKKMKVEFFFFHRDLNHVPLESKASVTQHPYAEAIPNYLEAGL